MIYKVIKGFADLQDNEHVYLTGDTFPREGLEVSDERIAELSTTANRRREVLIEAVETPQKAKKQPLTKETEPTDKEDGKAEAKPKKAKKKEK